MALGALADLDKLFEEHEARTIAELEARENKPQRVAPQIPKNVVNSGKLGAILSSSG
jgi:hypothetical protein